MRKFLDKSFFLIIPLLIAGIYWGVSTLPICLLVLLLRILTSDRHTVGIFLVLYAGTLCGTIRYFIPSIPLYGFVMQLVGLVLLWDKVMELFKKHVCTFKYLFAVFLVFGFSYVYADHTPYANAKILSILITGTMMVFGYYALCNSNRVSAERLTQLLLISSIIFTVSVLMLLDIGIGGVFDYNWLRQASELKVSQEQEQTFINYQTISITSLFGITVYLSQKKISIFPTFFYSLVSIHLILTGGARQAMIGIIIIIILRLTYFIDGKSPKRYVYYILAFLFAVVSIYAIQLLEIQSLIRMTEVGGKDRELLLLDSYRIFKEHFLFGVGLGGFPLYTIVVGSPYPHNLFMELLCETGFIGTILLFVVVFIYFKKNKITFRIATNTDSYILLIISALFIRVMFSSDLTESIQLFSCVFVLSSKGRVKLQLANRHICH